jgi:endonuclease YncB( thermonuclease family)
LADTVVKVTDGDTINVVNRYGEKVRVRLHCIDAPELKQDYGKAARAALYALAFGKEAQIKVVTRDKYKRSVANIVIDGELINLKMVELGAAWAYPEYCKDDRYALAEKQARQDRLGLWALKSPIRPSDFRRAMRKK